MDNGGSCWQISFEPQAEYSEPMNNFMEEFFDVTVCNYTDDGLEQLVGYKDRHFKEDELRQTAAERGLDLPPFKCELLTSDNWLKDNVIRFAPAEVGEFMIYGIHETTTPATDKLPLRIYAATAFGSEHQTTKSCLLALSELYRRKVPHQNILDMGCGSGILSLGAAKLWPDANITAVDIDEEAVIVTLQNARDNLLDSQIHAAVSDGYASALVRKRAPYDIIMANILARPLIEMAPDLYQTLKPGGYCILSGFVNDQEDWVVDAHRQQGLQLCKIYEMDNWRAALMEKRS